MKLNDAPDFIPNWNDELSYQIGVPRYVPAGCGFIPILSSMERNEFDVWTGDPVTSASEAEEAVRAEAIRRMSRLKRK
ncbi:MAG: hypothetical protein ACI9G1_003890 [Pirellulaceae bacterium]|jgi:hypothetical protein